MSHEVVLVEDDPDHAHLTQRALSATPHDVELDHVQDAASGIDRIRSSPPDLVLLDLDLGPSSGFEVLEALREDPQTACVPVVVLSTSTGSNRRRRCYLAGANSFVPRPLEYDELQDRLDLIVRYWLSLDAAPE